MTKKIDPTEVRNTELHRRIAAKIRRDPTLIGQAAAVLDRWMRRDGDPPDPALLEWKTAFEMLDPPQLADFLESPTPRAKRMRISSPILLARPMRRVQLEDLLCELARVLGNREVAMIGSQCVHAATDAPPVEVLMSRECDILIEDNDPVRERIDAELGSTSMYQQEHGTFIDTVSPSFPFLPDGWEQRANVLVSGEMRSRCLELHDLVLSKLAAGRLKDNELIAALIHYKLVNVDTARARIVAVADLHRREILLARLQIVLENVEQPG